MISFTYIFRFQMAFRPVYCPSKPINIIEQFRYFSMRKSDKKIDNQLRESLTQVCDTALKDIEGFQWLTHQANYSDFPNSLKITCVFDTNEQLNDYLNSSQNAYLLNLISKELNIMKLKIKSVAKVVSYDSEEHCLAEHKGNWARRLGN
ncbi:Fis family transcriptional regulator [Pseudoalteromonas phenolica]|uniref:Fis family transcriptional regulator n=2 Tax=Pseudoalteromonas phenolica TaxID=161398 RepID=A0A0S2K6Y7_9GAMM|nr:Fis family transcriptional regulator [Pseudoalteromonas phenolica]